MTSYGSLEFSISSGSQKDEERSKAERIVFLVNFEILFKSVNYRQLSLKAGLYSYKFPKKRASIRTTFLREPKPAQLP